MKFRLIKEYKDSPKLYSEIAPIGFDGIWYVIGKSETTEERLAKPKFQPQPSQDKEHWEQVK